MAADASNPAPAFRDIDGARALQTMVPMRDGAGMNTFVHLPPGARPGDRFPVILHRTPYGITSPAAEMWGRWELPWTSWLRVASADATRH